MGLFFGGALFSVGLFGGSFWSGFLVALVGWFLVVLFWWGFFVGFLVGLFGGAFWWGLLVWLCQFDNGFAVGLLGGAFLRGF